MPERDHLSIGEVLDLLQDDFPDVTISKIRFLESQGLLSPERTPSGYRKFYGVDLARLRWILTEQKDHFLPLKVIRERLDEDPPDFERMAALAAGEVPEGDAPVDSAFPDGPDDQAAAGGAEGDPSEPDGEGGGSAASPPRVFRTDPSGLSLTFEELCDASGLRSSDLKELGRLGMVQGTKLGDQVVYDENALDVARLAAAFLAHGVESRHLRTYKVAAEREAGFFEQLLVPVLKRRAPEDRAQAREDLEELAELGERMRVAMLRLSLSDKFGA